MERTGEYVRHSLLLIRDLARKLDETYPNDPEISVYCHAIIGLVVGATDEMAEEQEEAPLVLCRMPEGLAQAREEHLRRRHEESEPPTSYEQ